MIFQRAVELEEMHSIEQGKLSIGGIEQIAEHHRLDERHGAGEGCGRCEERGIAAHIEGSEEAVEPFPP